MTLNELLAKIDYIDKRVVGDSELSGVTNDSRAVASGSVFVAVAGRNVDGRDFVRQAVESGAVLIVAEGEVDRTDVDCSWLQVKDARAALSQISAEVYDRPSQKLAVVGITGTNGKTTTAYLCRHLIASSLRSCGMVGTIEYDDGSGLTKAERTTPEACDLQRMLAATVDNGCRAAVIEVSSHALTLGRVRDVEFDAGVFTNLTPDHLDFHKTMDEYFEAKALLGEQLAEQGGAKKPVMVVNIDDIYGQRFARKIQSRVPVVTYGFSAKAQFRALSVDLGIRGTSFKLAAKGREYLVRMPLIGRFNVYNALAALAVADHLDINFRSAVAALAEAPQVPGRMQSVIDQRPYRAFVDYAHTPDALENVLATLKTLKPARIITVFGCGGDRDKAKRPLMGRAASQLSDVCILTSDNPRSEDPDAILVDVECGMQGRYKKIVDRRDAIKLAIAAAGPDDVVLIAGKGHEDYQEINGERFPFSDRVEVLAADRLRDISAPSKDLG